MADRVGLTHFTTQRAAASILDGWRRSLRVPDGGEVPPGRPEGTYSVVQSIRGLTTPMRRTACPRNRRWDPRSDVIPSHRASSNSDRLVFPNDAFMHCGIKCSHDGESLGPEFQTNYLYHWRAYGDDGKGVALITLWDRNGLKSDGLEFVTVEYLQESRLKERQADLEQQSRVEWLHGLSRIKISDYETENEVRLVRVLADESGSFGPHVNYDASSGRLRTYVEWPVTLGTTFVGFGLVLGPCIAERDVHHWTRVALWLQRQMEFSSFRNAVTRSRLAYIPQEVSRG